MAGMVHCNIVDCMTLKDLHPTFRLTRIKGLCITSSFAAFGAISFITSVTTVTPQIMLPLVGDMAPPHRRATSLSIVVSGMLLGMLAARVLSGIVSQFIGWRYIYWIAFALQYLILILLYLFMPDYPSTNPQQSVTRTYPSLLWDIVKMVFKHPVLVQSCLVGFFTSSIFTSYWTTLTFLLAGPPYYYDSLIIGLFAMIGIGSMFCVPLFARTVVERHQPWMSVTLGELLCLVGVIVGTYLGKRSVAGPVIQAIFIDIGIQTSQIANRTAIYAVEPKARNRVNTAYMVSVFCGQLMGTAAGNHFYAQGGWIRSGSASVGFIGAALVCCFLRGPHEKGWVGWHGGANMKKSVAHKPPSVDHKDEETGSREQETVPQPFSTSEVTADEGEKRWGHSEDAEGLHSDNRSNSDRTLPASILQEAPEDKIKV